ncbi:MAG: PASTA domain-containing protein [Solirubrobacteraceae bacterium]|nr:PASTA domain-containing protein [Solirubrobacteraceae bacterium]
MKTPVIASNHSSSKPGRSRTTLMLAAIAALAVSFALLVSGCGDTTATVPNTVNQTLAVGQQMLGDKGFKSTVKRVTDKQGKDEILSQDPVGGTEQSTSDAVALTVSNGPGDGIVPNVAGDPADRAEQQIRDAGFKPVVVEVYSSAHQAGFAVGTTPTSGSDVEKDTKVTLKISKGAQQVKVPNVVGLTEGSADTALTNAGFRVDHSYQVSSKSPGKVLAQDPSSGGSASIGSSVQITIDQAPKKVTVPNAVGQTQSQGDRTLQNAGLDAVYATRIVTNRSQDGIVLAMSPGSGSKVLQGTNVALTIGKYNQPTPPVPPVPPPGPSSIVKQYNLQADQTKTYTLTWGAGTCSGGKGNAVLQGNGGGSAMSGAQITAQGQPTDNAYYATTTTSDLTSPVTLVITITCLVQ